MNARTALLIFLVVSFSMLTKPLLADDQRNQQVVASVTRVVHPKHNAADRVATLMTIHSPAQFRGIQFMMVTESLDRAEVRAEFPIGSLHVLGLPAKTIKEFKPQIDARPKIQERLDQGIDPHAISHVFLIPAVDLSELPVAPTALIPNIEQEERDASDSDQEDQTSPEPDEPAN